MPSALEFGLVFAVFFIPLVFGPDVCVWPEKGQADYNQG